MRIEGFSHRPGVHCGSTALADALRVRGLDLSEPMVFDGMAGVAALAAGLARDERRYHEDVAARVP